MYAIVVVVYMYLCIYVCMLYVRIVVPYIGTFPSRGSASVLGGTLMFTLMSIIRLVTLIQEAFAMEAQEYGYEYYQELRATGEYVIGEYEEFDMEGTLQELIARSTEATFSVYPYAASAGSDFPFFLMKD